MATHKETLVMPIVVITTLEEGRMITRAYSLDHLPPIVTANIRTLVGERCWMEVAYGDVVDDPKRYVERLAVIGRAEVRGLNLRELPSQYPVHAVASYDSPTPTTRILKRTGSKDPRVVKVVLDSGHDDTPPRTAYYLIDKLPPPVWKRIQEGGGYGVTKSPTQATQDSSPASQSGYSSVFFDDIRPRDLEDPEQVRAWNVAAEERERQIREALITGDISGYNVVMERVYSS